MTHHCCLARTMQQPVLERRHVLLPDLPCKVVASHDENTGVSSRDACAAAPAP